MNAETGGPASAGPGPPKVAPTRFNAGERRLEFASQVCVRNPMSRTVAIVLTLIVASTTSASRSAAQAPSPQDGQIRGWLDAVAQHRPGEADAAASQALDWTLNDVERLLP